MTGLAALPLVEQSARTLPLLPANGQVLTMKSITLHELHSRGTAEKILFGVSGVVLLFQNFGREDISSSCCTAFVGITGLQWGNFKE